MEKNIINILNWRYATKKYDVTKKLSAEQLSTILEAIRLAPTSYGLQPFKAFVVSNPEIRTKLRAAAWDQTQITDASNLIVFAVPKDITDADVDTFIALTAQTRNVPVETLAQYAGMIKGSISPLTPAARSEWAARQAYIALGVALSAAAGLEVDATPMEGFDPKQFDEILGLGAQNHRSIVLLTLGFRVADDSYATLAKVRFPKEVITPEIK